MVITPHKPSCCTPPCHSVLQPCSLLITLTLNSMNSSTPSHTHSNTHARHYKHTIRGSPHFHITELISTPWQGHTHNSSPLYTHSYSLTPSLHTPELPTPSRTPELPTPSHTPELPTPSLIHTHTLSPYARRQEVPVVWPHNLTLAGQPAQPRAPQLPSSGH